MNKHYHNYKNTMIMKKLHAAVLPVVLIMHPHS